MISRLPRWVEYGAFTLAALAGLVNVVGLLGFQHQSVSHLTGTASSLGTEIAALNPESFHLAGILLAFLLGAMLSGYLISNSSLKLGRHYDSLLVVEGLLLLLAVFFLLRESTIGQYLASAACGLQNALVSRYSGAVIRTTHLTGIFTDLGLMLGSALRGASFDRRAALLFLLIIFGFIGGGVGGTFLFSYYGVMALIVPASMCFILAIAYRWYLRGEPPPVEKPDSGAP